MGNFFTDEEINKMFERRAYYMKHPEESRKAYLERKMDCAPKVMTPEEFEREKSRRREMKKK